MLQESESVWSKSCGERDKEFSSLITVIITTLIDSILNYYYGSWFFILWLFQGMKLSSEATVIIHRLSKEQKGKQVCVFVSISRSRENFPSSKRKLQEARLRFSLPPSSLVGWRVTALSGEFGERTEPTGLAPSFLPLFLSKKFCPQDAHILLFLMWLCSPWQNCLGAKLSPVQV